MKTISEAGRDRICRITAWAFLALCGLAVPAIAYVATKGSDKFSDGWPIFFVFGAAFAVHCVGTFAQGEFLISGTATVVRKETHPFVFWILVILQLGFAIGLICLGVWGVAM